GYLRNIIFLVVLNLFIGYAIPGIDNLAHLGGLAGGALVAFGLDEQGSQALDPARRLVPVAVIVLAVILVAWRTANFGCG
ncbi:MAG: hypothetical protein QOK47_1516, partial [Actinomycetota bacterium]|nr:hypothetical protein [Actinomycetota bacterium]